MFNKIMVLVDDQPASRSAIEQGVAMAQAHHASVLFLYLLPAYTFPVMDMPGGGMAAIAAQSADEFEKQAQEEASTLLRGAEATAQAANVPSEACTTPGDASAEHIAETAVTQECQLIVVAASGDNAVIRLLTGSLIPGLISKSSVPVMVCPPARSEPAA